MNPISGFIITCLILVLGYGIGIINYLSDFEQDKCEMTYMFEYPQYVRISNKADKLFPKYGLYAYSEGRLTSKARNMFFDGIPVLFIPGNAGSYKQVRSLSSVALRKAVNSRTPFHFDYFTVDFNDELSGLYGPLLYEELNYVNSSLYRIFELYRERKNKPTSIILIGHSMGGVIARNLLSQISDPNLISVLIALAVPVKRAPLVLDYHMYNFYESNVWNIPETVNTTIISLSGGYSDFLIPTYLTDIQKNNSLSAVTSNIPRCWIEANHIQITWCKQVILAVNRALFDSVDTKTKQLSLNSTYRNMVFKQYIIDDSGTKVHNYNNYLEWIKIDYRGQWIENLLRQYSAQFFSRIKEPHWHMVRLTSLPAHEMLSVLAINLEVTDWIFACNANLPRGSGRVCTEAIHLSHLSKIWPSAKYKRRYFEINMHELRRNNSELTHIVFRALPTDEPVVFHVDVYNAAERISTVNIPKWWSLTKQIILERTPEKAVNYEFLLPQLQHIIQYYELFVQPINCLTEHHHASASLIVPWSNQNHHNHFTNVDKSPLKVRLHSSKPLDGNTQTVVIKLTLEPSCTYQISMKSSIVGMLGQITRFYTPLLLTNIAAVVLMALKFQLRSLKDGHCSIIFVAIKEGAKPYYVLTFAKILSKLFSGSKLLRFLPRPDDHYLIDDGIDFFVLPLLLYMCSVGIVLLLAVIFSFSLITLQSTVHKLALKIPSKVLNKINLKRQNLPNFGSAYIWIAVSDLVFFRALASFILLLSALVFDKIRLLARTVSFNVAWSDYLISALHKVPFIVAGSLILICFSTCGGLALCLGAIFYFLKLTQMSQDYVEEVVWFIIKKIAKICKNMLSRKKTNSSEKIGESNIIKSNAIEAVETLTNEDNNEREHVTDKLEVDDENQNDKILSDSSIGDLENQDNERIATEIIDSEDENKSKIHTNTEELNKLSKRSKQINKSSEDRNEGARDESRESNKEDIKDENKHKDEKHNQDDNQLSFAYNSIFFHSTLFFIWCIITLINIPAVLTWAHNFKFSNTLTPDDSFIPGLALSLCAFPLWQFEFPKIGRKWIDKLEIFVMIIAVVSLVFATISVYRLNYLLSLTIVTITLHQLFAPKLGDRIEAIDGDDKDNPREKYENIKTKIE